MHARTLQQALGLTTLEQHQDLLPPFGLEESALKDIPSI
jgi:hypothetical protein